MPAVNFFLTLKKKRQQLVLAKKLDP
jgi:hypothetical protein